MGNSNRAVRLRCEGWITCAYSKIKSDKQIINTVICLLAIKVLRSNKITRGKAMFIQLVLNKLTDLVPGIGISNFANEWRAYRFNCMI